MDARFNRAPRSTWQQIRWVVTVALVVMTTLLSGAALHHAHSTERRCFVYLEGEPEYWDYSRPGCGD